MRYRSLSVAAWTVVALGSAAVGLTAVSAVRSVVTDSPVRVLSPAEVERLLDEPDAELQPLATLAAVPSALAAAPPRAPDARGPASFSASSRRTTVLGVIPTGRGGAPGPSAEARSTPRPSAQARAGRSPAPSGATPAAVSGAGIVSPEAPSAQATESPEATGSPGTSGSPTPEGWRPSTPAPSGSPTAPGPSDSSPVPSPTSAPVLPSRTPSAPALSSPPAPLATPSPEHPTATPTASPIPSPTPTAASRPAGSATSSSAPGVGSEPSRTLSPAGNPGADASATAALDSPGVATPSRDTATARVTRRAHAEQRSAPFLVKHGERGIAAGARPGACAQSRASGPECGLSRGRAGSGAS